MAAARESETDFCRDSGGVFRSVHLLADGESAGTAASGEPVRKWLRRNGGLICCSRLRGPLPPPRLMAPCDEVPFLSAACGCIF